MHGRAKPTRSNPNGMASYCYAAVPVNQGQTRIRSFAVDQTGEICFDTMGANLCAGGALQRG